MIWYHTQKIACDGVTRACLNDFRTLPQQRYLSMQQLLSSLKGRLMERIEDCDAGGSKCRVLPVTTGQTVLKYRRRDQESRTVVPECTR